MLRIALLGLLGITIAGFVACGGDETGASPSSGGPLVDGAVPGPGPSVPGGEDGGSGDGGSGLTGGYADLGSSFVRLGLIGSSQSQGAARGWTLRLYPSGPTLFVGDTRRACEAPVLVGGCLVERCGSSGGNEADAGEVDAGTGPGETWSGIVTVADETHPRLLQIDLSTVPRSRGTAIAEVLGELPELMTGDVIHITTQDVTGFPALDLRLIVPSDAQLALASNTLSQANGTPVASVSQPGNLRLDLTRNEGTTTTTAACFYDRTQSQHTVPALGGLGFVCTPDSTLSLLPIGLSQAVVPGPAQAFVYVAVASTNNVSRGLGCAP